MPTLVQGPQHFNLIDSIIRRKTGYRLGPTLTSGRERSTFEMANFEQAKNRLSKQGLVRAFRHRDYAVFMTGHWVSTTGMWVQRVAVGWLTWELTHSGAWLGIIAAAQAIPSLVLLPISSTFADRVNRLKLLRVTQILQFLVTGVLALLVLFDLINIWLLLATVILLGLIMTFSMPASQTMAPNLVPKEDLSAAVAVGSVVFGSSAFIGPAISGLLIATVGIGWAFAFNSLSYLAQYMGIRLIRNFRHEHHSGGQQGFLADMIDGILYVGRHQVILPFLVLSVTSSFLLRPLSDLLPGLADRIFEAGPEGLATLFTAFGIGGMIGALWIANRNKMDGITTIFFAGSMTTAVLTLTVATTPSFMIAVGAMALMGLVGSAASNAAQIGIQHSVEGAMRARVMGLYTLNWRAAPSLGALLMGGLSAFFDLQLPLAISAIICLLAFALVLPRWRTIAELADNHPPG